MNLSESTMQCAQVNFTSQPLEHLFVIKKRLIENVYIKTNELYYEILIILINIENILLALKHNNHILDQKYFRII